MKKQFLRALLIGLAVLDPVSSAVAQTRTVPASQSHAPVPTVRIAPAAKAAAQVVDNFMIALSAGNLAAARESLDPGVVVISNALTLGTRDEYLAKQAPSDSRFLQKAQRRLLRRDARGGDRFTWVISEKLFRSGTGDQVSTQFISETMLLARTDAGWKIVHIHWSSRPVAGR